MADLPPQASSPQSSKSAFSYVLLIASVAGMGGLLFGYDVGVISGALLFIKQVFHLTPASEGFVTGSVLIGAIVGALAAGPYADRFGRRNANFLSGGIFAVGALLTAFVPAGETALLVLGRIVVGIGVGGNSVAAPMYIAEVAPPKYRGALVSLYQLAITIGIFVSYLVDTALAEIHGWRWMFGLAAIPAVLLMIGMSRMPRSPRWLVKRGLDDEAEAVLHRTIAADRVSEELAQIRRDTVDAKASGGARWGEVFSMPVRIALIVGVGLMFIQQLTGINTIIYYAPVIFKTAGYESNTAALIATTSVGLVNMLATLIAIWLVDKWGRKPLLILGLCGMILSLAVLGGAFYLHSDHSASGVVAATQQVVSSHVATHGSAAAGSVGHAGNVHVAADHATPPASAALGWTTVICLMTYITCFAFSLGPIAWLMLSEIFPNNVRSRAVAVATAANWIGNFIVAQTFLLLLDGMGAPLTFWLYAAVGAVSIVFIVKLVPETKGKSLEEIERTWLRKGA